MVSEILRIQSKMYENAFPTLLTITIYIIMIKYVRTYVAAIYKDFTDCYSFCTKIVLQIEKRDLPELQEVHCPSCHIQ